MYKKSFIVALLELKTHAILSYSKTFCAPYMTLDYKLPQMTNKNWVKYNRFYSSRSFWYATSAARLPLISIAPKVGPILGKPYAVETAIPVTIRPG